MNCAKKVSKCLHGDVILEKVFSIPKDFEKLKDVRNGFVVEKGEGIHTHRIATLDLSELADKVEIYTKGEEMYVKVKEPIKIDHEEHGKQIIEEGIWHKTIERQFDYENEVERRVMD